MSGGRLCRPAGKRPRGNSARHSGLRVCLCLLFCALFPGIAPAAPEEGVEASLPFGGNIPESVARNVARALAWHKVLEQAAQDIAASALVRMGTESSLQREALAGAVCIPTVQNKSSRRKSFVRVRPTLPLHVTDERLREILHSPAMLDTRIALLALEKTLAEEAASLLEEAAALRHRDGNAADAPLKTRAFLLKNQLEGLWLFGKALPLREEAHWKEPQLALRLLQQAAALNADAPFLRCALGEVLLQLDRPQDALEELNKAVGAKVPPVGALYMRGLTYLRLQLPSLAEQDLNAALERDPRPAAWWRARGALHMMRNNAEAMCADFLEACARGDCEGAALARKRGRCLPEPEKK